MIYILLLISSIALLYGNLALKRSGRRLPSGTKHLPGPPTIPLVGNLLQIPSKHSWLQFHEWSKQYGPVYRLNIAGREHVVVSTESIANDLLQTRGDIYSSREQMPMAVQLVSDSLRPVFLPYGDVWRKHRRLMHALTGRTVSAAYELLQEEESVRVLRDLIEAPADYQRLFERYSASLILRLAYSEILKTGLEPIARDIFKVVHELERVASPGAYAVDAFPFLMFLPSWLAPFKREAAVLHKRELNLFRALLDSGSRAASDSSGGENFSQQWAREKDRYGLTQDEAAYAIGTLFEAGAGTTAAAMMSWLLAMVLHEKEFGKLQQEIDAVVSKDRLPGFKDLPCLPRVRAVAKETLRWRPVTAGGLPHLLTKDDIYDFHGHRYFIPAGTNVHPVQWSIHRDEELYPEPDEFRPQRWLDAGWPTFREPLTQYPNLLNYSAWGFGRRICPGQSIAERSLYILIARIAWGCTICPITDEAGTQRKPALYEYTAGFNVQPKPFAYRLEARRDRLALIEQEFGRSWD